MTVEPEVAGLIDFSSLDLGGIEPVDLDIQNAYSSWLSDGNTGSLSDFQAATSETTPTDLTDTGAGSDTDTAAIAQPGLLASVLDPKPMIGLAVPQVEAPAAPKFNITERGRDLAIRTMIGEAAGEPDEGMAGVGAVTINRLKSGRWGDDLEKVVLAPNQFEPWSTRKDELLAIKPEDPQYQRAASIFDKVAKGEMPDPTKGALNFANPEIVAARGNTSALGWIDKMKTNGTGVQIGRHLFGNPDVAAGETTAPRPPGLVPFFKPQTIPVREGVDFAGIKPSVRGLYDRLSKAGIDGLEVVSGYRDPQRNARVGGASGSRHIEGDALDFNIEKLSDAQRQKLIDEAVAGGARGIGIYPGGRSVHIDMRETPTAWGANPDAPYSGVADPKAYPAWAQPGLQRLFGGEGGPRVQAAAFAPEERSRPPAPSYEDRMASIGAQRLPADGFDGSRLPNVQSVDTTQAERPGLLGDLLNPEKTIPGQAPLSNFKTIPGAIDPAFTYQDGPRGLPRAPEPTARDMVTGARTGGARPASIARDNRADNPAVRSATTSTTGGRALNPVMQEDLSNTPDGGARQFAAMEASRGGPFSMFGGGQEAPQAATGGVAPSAAGDVPAAGSAPVQSVSGGGAAASASGGGWKMSPVMSDFFLALGSSLLSSPKGQPLAGFGKTFAALQIASQETNKTAQQQAVLANELVKSGIPANEAMGLASNPAAAKMAVERVQIGAQRARQAAAGAEFAGIGGLTSDGRPSASQPSATAPVPAQPEPTTQAAPTGQPGASPPAAPASEPAPRAANPAQQSNMDTLMARRRQIVARVAQNPTEENQRAAKTVLDQLDMEIKALGDPLDREAKQLDVEGKRRALGKVEAPTVRQIKQPDGSEVAVQWDAASGTWVPLQAPTGGNAVKPAGKMTETQSKDLVYYNRGLQALEEFEKPGIGETYASGLERVATQVPGGNYVVSEEFQKAQQSGRNFLASILRKDTGAAITRPEEEQYGAVFLPQPGDKPGTLVLKREARKQAIEAIKGGLGTAEALARASTLLDRPAPDPTVRPDGSSPPKPSSAPDRAAVEAELRRRQVIK